MDWLQIFVNLVLTGVLLYVFQKVIDERSAIRLEKFKAELQSSSFEQETRFSKLHEKRAEVIEELYKKLIKIQNALYSLKNELGSEKTGYDTASLLNLIKEFDAYFKDNKIYLPENICEQIGVFYFTTLSTWSSLVSVENNMDIVSLGDSNTDDYKEKYKENLAEASSQLNEELIPLIKEIEKEFRKVLGS